jgi:hypothetical protein
MCRSQNPGTSQKPVGDAAFAVAAIPDESVSISTSRLSAKPVGDAGGHDGSDGGMSVKSHFLQHISRFVTSFLQPSLFLARDIS